MWTKIKAQVLEQVLWAEATLSGKSGEEKKSAVIERLISIIDIPGIPNFIEDPIKQWLFSWLIDLACEKLNWLKDWAFSGVTLEEPQLEKVAEVLEAPIKVMSKALAGKENATLDEKIDALYRAYSVDATEPQSVPLPEAPVAETTQPEPVVTSAQENWYRSAKFTLGAEGGESDHPADRGGHTNMGITESTLAGAYAKSIVPHSDISKLTEAEARAIYKALYWDNYGWGELPWPLCLVLFDATVNHGGGGMATQAQRSVNRLRQDHLDVDGKYGPKTKAAIWELSKEKSVALSEYLLEERKVYFDGIIARDSSQGVFKEGWYNRLKNLAAAVGITSPIR
jgi:lysozyme family protein